MSKRSKNFINKSFIIFFVLFWLSLSCCNSGTDVRIGQENAVWTESVFLRGFHPSNYSSLTEDYIQEYAETLKRNNIKYAYLFAGPFNKEGYLPEYAFSDTAVNSVKVLKKLYPEIIILPWVGGVQDVTVYLGDSTWIKNALSESRRLIQTLSVPGIHFDFEYILEGDFFLEKMMTREGSNDVKSYGNNVNEFHRQFRELMPEAFVSSVVVAPSPGTKPWKRKTTIDELRTLVKYVNQISFLFYDTSLNTQNEFEENCTFLLKVIQNLKNVPDIQRVQFLVSIGTFINEPELQKYRNLDIENIPNSLKTIKACLFNINPKEQIVDGISIYCNWQTDEDEWRQIYENWTKQNLLNRIRSLL